MRSSFCLLVLAASFWSTLAHYNFEALIVDGKATGPYEYVRQTSNANDPVEDIKSPDMICNKGGLDPATMAKTKTHKVAAGAELGFTINMFIGHAGPLSVSISKAPGPASEYKGDGDWVKIYQLTTNDITKDGLQWATWLGTTGISNFTFTLPKDTPPGNYLLRVESIALHGAKEVGKAQFYMGCAQIEVTGSGSGKPAPAYKIPGMYTGTEPGIHIDIYTAPQSYTPPGPPTWPNGCDDHTVNFPGKPTDGDCTASKKGADGPPAPNGPAPATGPAPAPATSNPADPPAKSPSSPKPATGPTPAGSPSTPAPASPPPGPKPATSPAPPGSPSTPAPVPAPAPPPPGPSPPPTTKTTKADRATAPTTDDNAVPPAPATGQKKGKCKRKRGLRALTGSLSGPGRS